MALTEEDKESFIDMSLLVADMEAIDVSKISSAHIHEVRMDRWSLAKSVDLETRWINLNRYCEERAVHLYRHLETLKAGQYTDEEIDMLKQAEATMKRLYKCAGEFKAQAMRAVVHDMLRLPSSKRGLWPTN
jgi:hypothetical protein